MTDNEIIKTLDKCINDDCDNCLNTFGNCQKNLMINALNYINKLEGEIENYKHLDVILNTAVDTLAQKIKSEAIKEFAERLNDQFGKCALIRDCFYVGYDINDVSKAIDNLVKEMVGGINAT